MSNDFDKEDGYTNEFQSPPVPEDIPDQQIDEPEEPVELFTPEQPPVNFTAERKAAGEPIKGVEPILSYVRESYRHVDQVLKRNEVLLNALHTGELLTTEHDNVWLATLFAGMNGISLDETPQGATERPGSHWRDGISDGTQGPLVRPGRPNQNYDKSKRNSKEASLAFLNYRAGMGGNFDTFLPHAGIWLRLRRPALGEIVAMQTELQEIRVKLGNETKGLAFSHAGFRQLDAVTDLAMSCVIASNQQYSTPSDLEEQLSIFDESLLHHALAAVMYPDGFNYSVPCVADPENCNGVTEFKMNMSNIVWYDDAVFTKEQRAFIAKRFQPGTVEAFKAYRDGFAFGHSKVMWLGAVGIKITPPSIAQRRRSAKLWYDTLIDMTKGAFNEPPEGNQRFEYIRRLQHATRATQYSHWVNAIYLEDDDAASLEDKLFTDDQELIMEFIASTISEDDYFDRFVEQVDAFSNESIIGLCALPSHNCPVCKSPQGLAYNERLPHLVPMDMLATFFTLAARKVT